LGLLALALALAALGAFQAVDIISDGLHDGATFAVGQTIPTSFGALTVQQVEMLDGLTSEDLSGVTHGIQNLVMSDKVQIQSSLQFLNRSNRPLAYTPGQFRLVGDGGQTEVEPSSGTLLTGSLPAHANMDVVLDFVTPRTNRPLWIEYQDPGQERPVRIAIGPADSSAGDTPPVPELEHSHEN
jgi:hypothetical protein